MISYNFNTQFLLLLSLSYSFKSWLLRPFNIWRPWSSLAKFFCLWLELIGSMAMSMIWRYEVLFEFLLYIEATWRIEKILMEQSTTLLSKSFIIECCSYTVSNKNTHLPVFEVCVFRVYLRNHSSYDKVKYIYFHPCLESFQIKQEFLKSGDKISWYLQKRCFARTK